MSDSLRPNLPWLACVRCKLHLSVPEEYRSNDLALVSLRVLGAHKGACRGALEGAGGTTPTPAQPRLTKRRKRKAKAGPLSPGVLIAKTVGEVAKTIGEAWAKSLMDELAKKR